LKQKYTLVTAQSGVYFIKTTLFKKQ